MSVVANDRVAIVLMKSAEADATLDVLRADHPRVRIADQGTYWHVSAQEEIVIDLDRVGEELGAPIALGEWLVIMSSFVGRAVTAPTSFSVTSRLLELEPAA